LLLYLARMSTSKAFRTSVASAQSLSFFAPTSARMAHGLLVLDNATQDAIPLFVVGTTIQAFRVVGRIHKTLAASITSLGITGC